MDRYKLKPQLITGRDGLVYPVFTIQASGRGWCSRRRFTPGAGVQCELEVTVLANEYNEHPIYSKLKYLEVLGAPPVMYNFACRPYVRKDGTFNVTDSWMLREGYECPFTFIYGVWERRGYFHVPAGALVNAD